MYLIKDIIQGCYNPDSEIYSYIQSYQDKGSISAFSGNFRSLVARTSSYDRDANNRLTTRFALYLDAFMQLTQGHLKPMLLFLEKHNDVTLFLCRHWITLERLYYEFKSQDNDIVLLDEYALFLDENYNVIRVDLLKNSIEISNEPFKKEFLYGFFKKLHDDEDTFFGRNQKEREEFVETMSSFFSTFHI